MFDNLQISDARERRLVGVADLVLRGLARVKVRCPPPIDASPKRILLLRLERIGDLLMALGAIADVRRLAPNAQIDLVVGAWNADLANAIPDLDRVEVLDVPWMARTGRGAGWPSLLRRAWGWRRRRYDLGINFEGDIRSNLLLGLSGATQRAGFTMRGGAAALTVPVEFSETAHTATNVRRLVRQAFGAPLSAPVDDDGDLDGPRLPIPKDAMARAETLLGPAGPGTLIGIQASAGRDIKQWDPDRFAQAGAALAREYDATLVITGTESERRITERVKRALDRDVRVVDLTADMDVPTLGGIIERLALLITCDTGPMHLAAAVGTPIVAIFGPSLPSRFAPLSRRSRVVRVDLPCSPCNQLRKPPSWCVGHVPDCLTAVEVPQVVAAARDLLGAAHGGGSLLDGPGQHRRSLKL